VRRLFGFVVHNWPLKLAAVALATLLYAGLVLSQNARVWPGPISIQVLHQPTNAFIIGDLPNVTSVRYFAPVGVADRLSSAGFSATIDLANAAVDAGQPVLATVNLTGPNGVNILDYTPREIYVRIDPLSTRTVPIHVTHGVVPEGLSVGETEVSQSTATVSGPQSVVMQVVAAEARVRIQSSGIDVDQLVDLVPVDGRDEVLSPVQLSPASVRVRIPVGSPVTTKSVPVTAVVNGTPADGFTVGTVAIAPAVATVTGEAATLAGLTSVQTAPVDVNGASATIVRTVGLELPATVTAVGDQAFEVTVTLRPTDSSRNFTSGIIVVGADTNRTYVVGVESVIVTLGGGDQALNDVDASSFAASINVAGLAAGSHEVDVRVVPPSGLKLLAFSPPRVTVLVGDVATPPPTPTPTPLPTLEPSITPEPATAEPSVSGAAGAGVTPALSASASP
jgi:YbbR domain-containing protein